MEPNVPSPTINWDSDNLPDAWKKFKQHVQLMFSGPLASKSEAEKVSYLLIWVGEKGRDICNTFKDITDENSKLLATYFTHYEKYVSPKSNTVFARFKFHTRVQTPLDTFDKFTTDLKLLVKDCGYAVPDEMVRDRIVFGVSSQKIREKLITFGSELTLDKAVELAHTIELSESQMRSMAAAGEPHVNQVMSGKKIYTNCHFCGGEHAKGQCPAFGTTCSRCGDKNHWAKQCEKAHDVLRQIRQRSRDWQSTSSTKSKTYRGSIQQEKNTKHVHEIHDESDESDENLRIYAVSRNKKTQLQVKLHVRGRNATLYAQVDTGAAVNLLPLRCFKQLYPEAMLPDGKPDVTLPLIKPQPLTTLTAYGGHCLQHYGTTTIVCGTSQTYHSIQFFICESDGPIILGLKDSREMRLIELHEDVTQVTIARIDNIADPQINPPISDIEHLKTLYPLMFTGVGKFPHKVKLHLKESATPVVQAPRRCPIHIRKQVQESLDNMECQGIISKLPRAHPTEWISNLVYARKPNGKLRICLDPRELNAHLKRTYHRAPTVEEITHTLSGAQVFSKLDARNGYWSLVLDDESSLYTAFNGLRHRYKFNRLPFGLNVSQDLFQEAMDEITRDMEGVISIADDVCVFGKDDAEHNSRLHAFMKKGQEFGLVLNPDKCTVKVPEITFFGNTYNKTGVRPDPDRVEEITNLPEPRDRIALQSLLGMVQYVSPFIPNLSDLTAPLRNLLKKDAAFVWMPAHQKAFQSIKDIIAAACTLYHFNPAYDTKIQVDASMRGLGAALIQMDPKHPNKERIIAFASKSLTDTEARYANIEREFLAVVFGAEKFHTYIYGAQVVIETDHKPLESIYLKNLAQAPPRLQRMMLRLQQYDIEIKYRKGSELLLADFLSRYRPKPAAKEISLEHTIHSIQWSDDKLTMLRSETQKDKTLFELFNTVISGWPDKTSELSPAIKPYWSIKDFLSIDDGILLKGQQVMVPESMQTDVLSQLHRHSHQGIEKTRALARKCIYWLNINEHIAREVSNCMSCNEHSRSQAPEPMYERDIPEGPWQILGTDLFMYNSQKYLMLADYFSKFPIVRKLSDETSSCVIKQLKSIFSEYGVPHTVMSDNGPCFSSVQFKQFANEYGFKHTTSSPHFHQSNGLAERMVGIAKSILKKCKDPDMAFLLLRSTPIAGDLPSPAELLFNRQLRSGVLPSSSESKAKDETTKKLLQQKQQRQKMYFDRSTMELPDLKPGDLVMLQSPRDLTWKPGTVVSLSDEPRSYIVQTTDGTRYRRNRGFIKKLKYAPLVETNGPEGTESLEKEPRTLTPDPPRRSSRVPVPTKRLISEV